MTPMRTAIFLSILTLGAGVSGAGGRRYQPLAETPAAVEPSPPPRSERDRSLDVLEQRQMSIGEMVAYFTDLKPGTALRLTYSNGAEYAGNFEGREPGRALIYCRNGLCARRQVPLRKVMDAYVIVSSTWTLRIHQKDFPWRTE